MTAETITKWHEEGAKKGYLFMLLVEDLETGSVEPKYYADDVEPQDVVKDYEREREFRRMLVHACYSLRSPIADQLSDGTPWHFSL